MARFVFFFVAHSPLRSAARKPHLRCGYMHPFRVHVYTRMRGALSARTILTRSHVCAGVSVRLCFFVTSLCFGRYASGACFSLRAHSPDACTRIVHVRAGACMKIFEAHSPHLFFNPSGLLFELLQKQYFFEICQNSPPKFKIRGIWPKSPSGRLSHTRHSRAHNRCTYVQACICKRTQPRDVCVCGQSQRI